VLPTSTCRKMAEAVVRKFGSATFNNKDWSVKSRVS
jgi:hypothetical protein